jgi:hypothetical protein
MWPISTRVNKPENDDPSILDRRAEPVDWQAPLDGSDPGNEHRSGAESRGSEKKRPHDARS